MESWVSLTTKSLMNYTSCNIIPIDGIKTVEPKEQPYEMEIIL